MNFYYWFNIKLLTNTVGREISVQKNKNSCAILHFVILCQDSVCMTIITVDLHNNPSVTKTNIPILFYKWEPWMFYWLCWKRQNQDIVWKQLSWNQSPMPSSLCFICNGLQYFEDNCNAFIQYEWCGKAVPVCQGLKKFSGHWIFSALI